jgi:hypothetical protein
MRSEGDQRLVIVGLAISVLGFIGVVISGASLTIILVSAISEAFLVVGYLMMRSRNIRRKP